jgi:hypothetical protein
VAIVRLTHAHPTLREIGSFACGARNCDDIGRRYSASEQFLNRETTKVA